MPVERLAENEEFAHELEALAEKIAKLGARFRGVAGARGAVALAEARAPLLALASTVAPKLVTQPK